MAVMTVDTVAGRERDGRPELLHAHGLTLNLRTKELINGGPPHYLPPKQFALMRLFMEHDGLVLERSYVMRQVWHTEYLGDTRTLDVHVHMLRRLFERDPHNPRVLHTIRGHGYLFGDSPR